MKIDGHDIKDLTWEPNQSAEAIAKWLGWKRKTLGYHETDEDGTYWETSIDFPESVEARCDNGYGKWNNLSNWGLIDWLASDAGTVAMILKMRDGSEAEAYALQIAIFSCESINLNKELQAAILEVVKNG